MFTDIKVHAIGVVESSLKSVQDPPPKNQQALQEATLRILPQYCLGLAGTDQLKKLVVLYWLHQGDREVLRVYPGGDRSKEMIGVFRNRSPLRPNPIGISVDDILEVGVDFVRVRGLDAIDGTPIIDLKSP